MNARYVITGLLAACCIALLPACSTTKKANNMNVPIADLNQQSQQGDGTDINGLGGPDNLQGPNSAYRMKAPYNQTYYFEFNRDQVESADIPSIKVQANYLVTHSNARVRLEGNADERGSREYNVALGWRRAKAVAAILAEQGVNQKQIAMVSYGKEKPATNRHDDEAYRLNRRVNLIYEAK